MIREEKIVLGLLISMLIASMILVYCDIKDWNEFSAAHNCKVVGEESGQVFNTVGFGANGQATVGIGVTAPKTGYLCDDGVTYWR